MWGTRGGNSSTAEKGQVKPMAAAAVAAAQKCPLNAGAEFGALKAVSAGGANHKVTTNLGSTDVRAKTRVGDYKEQGMNHGRTYYEKEAESCRTRKRVGLHVLLGQP